MARITEPDKIEKIRYSIMEMIAESGYENISIAKVSERSGVSVGYLYRYYKGKDELIMDLLDSHLQDFKDRLLPGDFSAYDSMHDLWLDITRGLFEMANQDRILARFLTKIIADPAIPDKKKALRKKEMLFILEKLHALGRKAGEIAEDILLSDMALVVTTLPFMYIGMELDEDKDKVFTEAEVKKVTRLCMNALK